MRKQYLIYILISQIILLSSCLTTKDTNLLVDPGNGIPNYPKVEKIGDYIIKPGDELLVTIQSELDPQTAQLLNLFSRQRTSNSGDNMSKLQVLTVSPAGLIYFPYIGNIRVKGKTTLEVEQLLSDFIEDRMSDECILNVRLGNRYYSVIGESTSNRYRLSKEKITIFQAMAQSRDMFPYGDRSKVKIIRQTNDGTTVKTFDLRSIDIVNSEFYYIQPDDVIYIQPMKKQFWGISSFGAFFAIISTVSSLGIMIFRLVK